LQGDFPMSHCRARSGHGTRASHSKTLSVRHRLCATGRRNVRANAHARRGYVRAVYHTQLAATLRGQAIPRIAALLAGDRDRL